MPTYHLQKTGAKRPKTVVSHYLENTPKHPKNEFTKGCRKKNAILKLENFLKPCVLGDHKEKEKTMMFEVIWSWGQPQISSFRPFFAFVRTLFTKISSSKEPGNAMRIHRVKGGKFGIFFHRFSKIIWKYRGSALKTSEWRRTGKIWINLAHAQTKCLSAQPVTVERYPPLGDTKPVNHSTDASSFTCSVGKKFHCEAKDNTQVLLF